jgi:hypothetical protein
MAALRFAPQPASARDRRRQHQRKRALAHRGIEYLHDLDRRLDPYQDSSAVRGFRERLGRLAVRQSALPLVLAPAIPR